MILPPLHLPLISAGFFGGVVGRMLDFIGLRIRRSDQGMAPSLSPDLRAQTWALHRRLAVLTREFHRLAELARQGRLRVYPDRKSPARRDDAAQRPGDDEARRAREKSGAAPASVPASVPVPAFDQAPGVPQGPTLPAVATRGFGWMLGFVPAEHGPALAAMLTNPEMVALIQASPAVARLLRPLCHGLGVVPPEGVFPPPRRRAPRRASGGASSGASGGASDARDGESSMPAPASRRAVVAEAVISPRARDRWWEGQRAAAARPGRCVKT